MNKTTEEVKAIKNELRNYKHNCKKYEKILDKLDTMWYNLAGVRAADASKIPVRSYNPSYSEEMRLEALEQIEILEIEKRRLEAQIQYVEKILSLLEEDIRGPITSIYINKKTFLYTSVRFNLSESYLQYRIDKCLSDIIKKEDI